MFIELLKSNLTKGKQEVSKIYCCGNATVYKIGQTAQTYMCQRLQTIRRFDKDIQLYAYVEFVGSKALREFVESSVRLYIESKGYKLQGNDHFIRKGNEQTFRKHVLEITTAVLNELNIDYKVINKI